MAVTVRTATALGLGLETSPHGVSPLGNPLSGRSGWIEWQLGLPLQLKCIFRMERAGLGELWLLWKSDSGGEARAELVRENGLTVQRHHCYPSKPANHNHLNKMEARSDSPFKDIEPQLLTISVIN